MEFADFGWDRQMGDVPIGFSPSDLPNLKLWTRYNSGITETGSGVSQWDDVSGNGNHLKQATDLDRPQKQADGSILCDGIRQFLKADAFTLAQPETIFLLVKQITWTLNDTVFDGNTSNSGRLYNVGATPQIGCYAGAGGAIISTNTLDEYAVLTVVFDHDNTLNLLQRNNETPATDTAFGTADMGGFKLGANGGETNFSHIQVKEAVAYADALDASQRAQIINYLSSI